MIGIVTIAFIARLILTVKYTAKRDADNYKYYKSYLLE